MGEGGCDHVLKMTVELPCSIAALPQRFIAIQLFGHYYFQLLPCHCLCGNGGAPHVYCGASLVYARHQYNSLSALTSLVPRLYTCKKPLNRDCRFS
ncbi:hypothetical protein KC323_g38 [Hortaea werneckii]|nr:hypothetical protein KC323_g38 [Hortaea werneckii]